MLTVEIHPITLMVLVVLGPAFYRLGQDLYAKAKGMLITYLYIRSVNKRIADEAKGEQP
jgi:hypothetical protein